MKIAYKCETCGEYNDYEEWVDKGDSCGIELCDKCMYGYSTCNGCAKDRTEEEIKLHFEEIFEYENIS